MEDWVLLVVVIIIVYIFASGKYKGALAMIGSQPQASAPASDAQASEVAATDAVAPGGDAPTAIEAASAVIEQKREGLEMSMIEDGIRATNGEMCVAGSAVSAPYAAHDYGHEGMQFVDWAMKQTVDPRIIESNRKFVAERPTGSRTGLTYSPDAHDPGDAVPWVGLARPARVFVGSPDQVPDLDIFRNPADKRFRWKSDVFDS
jgi:hypothetical protein